jgi:hypothetical protein
VPEDAGIVAADVLPVLPDVRDDENFGQVVGQFVVGELQFAQLAEPCAEPDVVLVAQFIASKINDFVLVERIANRREVVVR